MSVLLREFEKKYCIRNDVFRDFKAGDTVSVFTFYKDGNKEKTQMFSGTVMQRRHPNTSGETFTVIKKTNNIKVEKTFSINSPNIKKIEKINTGDVSRARLFYLRKAKGKDAKIKTRIISNKKPDVELNEGAINIDKERNRYNNIRIDLGEKRFRKLHKIKEVPEDEETEGSKNEEVEKLERPEDKNQKNMENS